MHDSSTQRSEIELYFSFHSVNDFISGKIAHLYGMSGDIERRKRFDFAPVKWFHFIENGVIQLFGCINGDTFNKSPDMISSVCFIAVYNSRRRTAEQSVRQVVALYLIDTVAETCRFL